jgi:hypothetical protein
MMGQSRCYVIVTRLTASPGWLLWATGSKNGTVDWKSSTMLRVVPLRSTAIVTLRGVKLWRFGASSLFLVFPPGLLTSALFTLREIVDFAGDGPAVWALAFSHGRRSRGRFAVSDFAFDSYALNCWRSRFGSRHSPSDSATSLSRA